MTRSRRSSRILVFAMAATLLGSLHAKAALSLTPEARARHVAIYDPVGQRMIVWGGDNGSRLFAADVWSLNLSPGVTPTWSKLNVSGAISTTPRGAAAVYDSRRHCVYIHGGGDLQNQTLNNLYILTFPTPTSAVWSTLTQDVDQIADLPTFRMYHSMVYDSVGDKVYLFGGRDGATRFGDTFVMTATSDPTHRHWARVTASSGPEPRYGHVSFFDSIRRRMVIMGGVGNSSETTITPTWALSVSGTPAWSQIYSFGGPPNLRFASAMYHPVWDRTWITGGTFIYPWDSYMNAQDNAWVYAFLSDPQFPSGWSSDVQNGPASNAVYQHTTVFDSGGNRLIKFGGADIGLGVVYTDTPTSVLNTTWQLTQPQWQPDATWSQIGISGPGANKKSAGSPGSSADAGAPLIVSGGLGSTPVRFRSSNASVTAALRVEIFDVRGRVVRTLVSGAVSELAWDRLDRSGHGVAAGVYFYHAVRGSAASSGSVLLTK